MPKGSLGFNELFAAKPSVSGSEAVNIFAIRSDVRGPLTANTCEQAYLLAFVRRLAEHSQRASTRVSAGLVLPRNHPVGPGHLLGKLWEARKWTTGGSHLQGQKCEHD